MKKCLILILVFAFGLNCTKQKNDANESHPDISGFETTVTCKAGVKELIYVKIVSGKQEEDFGVIGAPEDSDSGATIAFSPLRLKQKTVVRWGVDGEDDLKMTHSKEFDLSGYISHASKIRSVEFIYFGGEKWKFKAYDAPGHDANKKEITPDETYEASNSE